MDILDRLLGHDAWTTRQLLLKCRELSDEQLEQHFDIGPQSLKRTFVHIIENMEVWNDLIHERAVLRVQETQEHPLSINRLIERLDIVAADFEAFARKIADEDRLDQLWVDYLDNPPTRKTFGGAIAHVITHNMHHRAQILYMLDRMGVPNVIEGDVLSWEQQARSKST